MVKFWKWTWEGVGFLNSHMIITGFIDYIIATSISNLRSSVIKSCLKGSNERKMEKETCKYKLLDMSSHGIWPNTQPDWWVFLLLCLWRKLRFTGNYNITSDEFYFGIWLNSLPVWTVFSCIGLLCLWWMMWFNGTYNLTGVEFHFSI